jgi:hypothetical protein
MKDKGGIGFHAIMKESRHTNEQEVIEMVRKYDQGKEGFSLIRWIKRLLRVGK